MRAGTNPLRTRNSKAQRAGTLAIAAAVTAAALGAGAAAGQTPGGLEPPKPPVIRDVTCSVRCLDVRTVAETGRIEITGANLGSVQTVRFPGGDGKLEEKPRSSSDSSVVASVPVGAASGKVSVVDRFGNKVELGRIGIVTTQETGNFRVVEYSPLEAVGQGALQRWHIVTGTFDYLSNILAGRMKADQLGGPIRVAQASGQMATLGVAAVLNFAAILSVSIGLLNLMPVPVLDGGHLMFYAVEAVRGKPLGSGAQEIAFRIGLAMVLTLMVFATWNDISALIG